MKRSKSRKSRKLFREREELVQWPHARRPSTALQRMQKRVCQRTEAADRGKVPIIQNCLSHIKTFLLYLKSNWNSYQLNRRVTCDPWFEKCMSESLGGLFKMDCSASPQSFWFHMSRFGWGKFAFLTRSQELLMLRQSWEHTLRITGLLQCEWTERIKSECQVDHLKSNVSSPYKRWYTF